MGDWWYSEPDSKTFKLNARPISSPCAKILALLPLELVTVIVGSVV